jgi:hypothetical protein
MLKLFNILQYRFCPSIYGSTVFFFEIFVPFFSFLILYRVGRTPWTRDQSVARPLPTHRTTQRKNERKQISMPCAGWEHRISAFEQVKRVHALDRVATVIGSIDSINNKAFWVTLSYFVGRFISLFPIWKLCPLCQRCNPLRTVIQRPRKCRLWTKHETFRNEAQTDVTWSRINWKR